MQMFFLVISCSSCLINMHYYGFWGGYCLCKKGTRARNNNESATKSSYRKNRSRLSAKLPVRIMAGIIASDNSELMD